MIKKKANEIAAQIIKMYMSQEAGLNQENIIRIPFTVIDEAFSGYNTVHVMQFLDRIVEYYAGYQIILEKEGNKKEVISAFKATGRDANGYFFEMNERLKSIQ